MSNYLHIAGSPRTGIVVLGDDGTVRSLGQAEPASAWQTSPKFDGFVSGEAAFSCLLGGGAGYTTVAHGTAIRVLATLGQAQARWKDIAPLPADTSMACLAGDHQDGYLLLAADGHGLYRLGRGADNTGGWSQWEPCATPPLPGKATLIAGDWQHGMLVVGNGAVAKLARSGASDTWTALPVPPLAIEMVTGNFHAGFIAYGEGQLCMLDTGAQPKWRLLPTPEFDLRCLSGNPAHGLAAVLADSSGDGALVVYTLRPDNGPWSLALAPQATRR